MSTQPIYPLLTAKEFLEFDFGDLKAELDNGVIRMMAGGRSATLRLAATFSLGCVNGFVERIAGHTDQTWRPSLTIVRSATRT
jgi:hypothetical protein